MCRLQESVEEKILKKTFFAGVSVCVCGNTHQQPRAVKMRIKMPAVRIAQGKSANEKKDIYIILKWEQQICISLINRRCASCTAHVHVPRKEARALKLAH